MVNIVGDAKSVLKTLVDNYCDHKTKQEYGISAWCQHVYYYLDKRGNIELVADYGKEHSILQRGRNGSYHLIAALSMMTGKSKWHLSLNQ